jgi:hypothetical protein
LWCLETKWSILMDWRMCLYTLCIGHNRLPARSLAFSFSCFLLSLWAECVIELNSSEKPKSLYGGTTIVQHKSTQVLFCVVTRLWSKRNDDRVTQATNDLRQRNGIEKTAKRDK